MRRRRGVKRRGLPPAGLRGLPLTYELRRVSRDEFDRRYQELWPRPERPTAAASWERGREAFWQHVLGCYALLSARGQHCGTTNGQRGQALTLRGQQRCRRTLQRYSRKLDAMGLCGVLHVRAPRRRDGSPGKDCLRLEWRLTRSLPMLHVTHPSGTVNPWLRQGGSPPYGKGVAPPPAADDGPPDEPGERPVTREVEIAAQLRFQRHKLAIGFGNPAAVKTRIAQLEFELSGQERDRTASTSWVGFR